MTHPPFFVVGPSRSGSTLLGRILGTHSRLAVYIETQYYPILGPDRHRYGDFGNPANLRRLVRDVVAIAREQKRMSPPTVEEILAALPAPSFEGVLAAWLQVYAMREEKARGGDKTPEHVRFLPEILAAFPQSPVVFTMRDPRDVAISSREAFGSSAAASAWAWRDAFEALRRASPRVHLVRYEDLVGRPAEIVSQACAFLGERWEPEMLRFFDAPPQGSPSTPHHRRLRQPVDPSSVGRFRALAETEIAEIEAICADGMDDLGYARSVTTTPRFPPPPPGRLAAALNRIRFYLRQPRRIRRGWTRWRIVLRVRARWLLSLAWARSPRPTPHAPTGRS
jgi:hypothetical protein